MGNCISFLNLKYALKRIWKLWVLYLKTEENVAIFIATHYVMVDGILFLDVKLNNHFHLIPTLRISSGVPLHILDVLRISY
jgi:hypothetical protein